MQIDEILIIRNAGESYGIATENINQISRVPTLMPLPLRPKGVRGLCSVAGNVVSMVDMNLLLGMQEVDLDASKSRVISLTEKLSSNTILVSDVYNTVEVEKEKIEYLDNPDDAVVAIYKYEDLLVQVLSLDLLISSMSKVEIPLKEVSTGKVNDKIVKEEDSSRFLIFSMSTEKYALEIDYLQEIILADVEYTDIAGTSSEVLGLITLREELLLVVDLRRHYGFEPRNSDENRILVVSYDGKKVGLCIDSIIDIKNFYKKNVEYMSESFEDDKIAGVIHEQESLISFFDSGVLNTIFKENENYIDSKEASIIEDKSGESFAKEVIVFKLSDREYAFNVDSVNEIIDVVSSTKVAFSDENIDGIINIRGQIVTTISLFKKLNLKTQMNEDSKIIICNINESRIGFVVDSVSDILNVKEEEIRQEDNDSAFFESTLCLDNGNRLVLSMDVEKIVKRSA
ncbi:MAG: chemotaxis protein CheW [Campylobacterota bacterium]|nr:chemotaxis protein CheW [Campylobacterota bacterium]